MFSQITMRTRLAGHQVGKLAEPVVPAKPSPARESFGWAVDRSFAWTSCFRQMARDFERTPETFRSLHFLAFATLMLHSFVKSFVHNTL